jgi:hypothetical protein
MKTLPIDIVKNRLNRYDIAEITFLKKTDGSRRTMICTNKIDRVPAEHRRPSGNSTGKKDDMQQRVYDIEKGAWRSFLLNTVLSIKEHNG